MWKSAPDKTLLARASRLGLPDDVLRRPKAGVLTPMTEWLARSKTLNAGQGRLDPPNALAALSRHLPNDADLAAVS
jgi:hypothetical protein